MAETFITIFKRYQIVKFKSPKMFDKTECFGLCNELPLELPKWVAKPLIWRVYIDLFLDLCSLTSWP